MKKLLLTSALFALMCCDVRVEPRQARADGAFVTTMDYPNLRFDTYQTSGMTFGLFYVANGSSQTGYGVAVVNLTKDRLETEKLELEIAELRARAEKRNLK